MPAGGWPVPAVRLPALLAEEGEGLSSRLCLHPLPPAAAAATAAHLPSAGLSGQFRNRV